MVRRAVDSAERLPASRYVTTHIGVCALELPLGDSCQLSNRFFFADNKIPVLSDSRHRVQR